MFAAYLTHSSAVLAEGMHSLVDGGNEMLLLYGIYRAGLPADELHPFGHGQGALLLQLRRCHDALRLWRRRVRVRGRARPARARAVGAPTRELFRAGCRDAVRERELRGGAQGLPPDQGPFRLHRGRAPQQGSFPFLVLLEDTAALVGLGIAFAGVALAEVTQAPVFDAAASIGIGVVLGLTAAWLGHETRGLLIGESASETVVRGIRGIAAGVPGIRTVNEVLTMQMGPDFILVNVGVEFCAGSERAIETTVAEIERRIRAAFPAVKRIFIEADRRHQQERAAAITAE